MEPNPWETPQSQQNTSDNNQNGSDSTLKIVASVILFFLGVIGLLASACGILFLFSVPEIAIVSLAISLFVSVVVGVLFYKILKNQFQQPKKVYVIVTIVGLIILLSILLLIFF
ncbi:hypothetical protein [Neisseria sp. Ec49-e6-T10]|uniref:hypothetical protein n=1 Tax=Neisseria sp. Ec49-e6-T10 TaxID=3140744 RepID=UPI003EBF8B13